MIIFRRYFLGFCSAVGLCGFVQMVSAAEINAPTAGWTVGRISAKSENGITYCSMKNSYQNGQMLVFARDGGGANSIALDFQKDKLEIGRQYNMTIRAGAVTRRITALAATRQVIIMQMGVDRDFYRSLGSKNSLSFSVGGHKHVFSLKASAKALKVLDDCTAALQSNFEFAQVTVPLGEGKEGVDRQIVKKIISPSGLKKDSIESVQSRQALAANKNLKKDIEKLRIENKKLSLENQKIQGKLIEQENTAVKVEFDLVKQKALKSEHEKLARETIARDKLKAETVRLKVESDLVKQKALKVRMDKLKAENQKLVRESKVGQKALKVEMAHLKVENEKLAREIIAQNEIKTETARLKAENERLAHETIAQNEIKTETVRLKAENEKPVEQIFSVEAPEKIDFKGNLKALLLKARMAPEKVIRIDESSSAGIYRWEFDNIFGSAQELPWVSNNSFIETAELYVKQAAFRCKGDFAENTGKVKKVGRMDIFESEIVCLDGQINAAAALLFMMDRGRVSVVMQEGTVDQMTEALSKRDLMVSAAFVMDY